MKKRKLAVVMLTLIMVFALMGCGASSDSAATQSMSMSGMMDKAEPEVMEEVFYDEEVYEEYKSETTAENGSAESSSQAAWQTQRKLIKTVDMRVETKEFDELLSGLSDQIASCNGYVEQMETKDMDVMSDFLVMAATLLKIKSKIRKILCELY